VLQEHRDGAAYRVGAELVDILLFQGKAVGVELAVGQGNQVGAARQACQVGVAGQVRRERRAEHSSTPKILRVTRLGLSFMDWENNTSM